MRTPARTGTTLTAAVAALTVIVTLGAGGASAQPGGSGHGGDGGTPTKAQVAKAKADAADKAHSVAAIRADLGAAQDALDAASIRAAQASERYNGAMWHLGLAKKAAKKADARAVKAAHQVSRQRDDIARMVVDQFRGGTQADQLSILVNSDSTSDVLAGYGAMHSATSSMDATYDAYRAARTRAQVAKAKAGAAAKRAGDLAVTARKARDAATAAQRDAAGRTAAIQKRTDKLTHELAVAQHVSTRLATERARAIRLAAARAAAKAAAAAAAAAAAKQGDQSGSTATDPTPPAPSGGAAAAIAFAKQQLGDPYVWGGTGPNTWDCSGLMLMSWRAGGKSLPRTAAEQYAATTHISSSQLQPGDLVFWGSSPGGIYHVAMYLGGGLIIQAPHTGATVEISGIDSWIYPEYFSRP